MPHACLLSSTDCTPLRLPRELSGLAEGAQGGGDAGGGSETQEGAAHLGPPILHSSPSFAAATFGGTRFAPSIFRLAFGRVESGHSRVGQKARFGVAWIYGRLIGIGSVASR